MCMEICRRDITKGYEITNTEEQLQLLQQTYLLSDMNVW